ncbi:leucyl aminopeptidase [Sphingomonas jejuensis]|uniref:Leucyl aminopeptidase n=1 Tax=Sphingomonas jejuensis TaxID=904715 RepID=A0ABX0XJM5_9SPHN|nr:leucyl aminopeptidase family protein [Sphingomonas jejuensis]NJC33539.1 leucyl aminopeptidase [Sphingomonas jejuensis]
MTDFRSLLRPDRGESAHSLHLVDPASFKAWLQSQPLRARAMVEAARFTGKAGEVAILPGDAAEAWSVAVGVADAGTPGRWCLARAAEQLPAGTYRAEGSAGPAAHGWLLAQHRFDRYRKDDGAAGPRILLTQDVRGIEREIGLASAVATVRDLVNTPADDMGPAELEMAVRAAAEGHGAQVSVTTGDALEQGYPMIHAVGRAAARPFAPRLIELTWGDPAHPRVAVVGKGVCFDSGGLDIKPASGMRLMKKDMGGAAHAIALAGLIMAERLPIRLHLLIPAVENAISGHAFRPGDILRSRAGTSVEIGNTDAEGRLILADAITRAVEEEPALLLDFATLTGAARIALGPDLPALFANDDALAADLLSAGTSNQDPLWRLPLWDPYAEYISSDVADLANAGDTPFAGTITAALFLKRFVPAAVPWAHLDLFAWRPSARPGRPKGGEALGLLAAWAMLRGRYDPQKS